MKYLRELKRRWKAETPIMAKKVRNTALLIASSLPTGWSIAKGMEDITLPNWVGIAVFIVVLVCGTIGAWAGLKEVKRDDFK